MRKAVAIVAVTGLVIGCTPELQSQFEQTCDSIRVASAIIATMKPPKRVQLAMETAEAICAVPPTNPTSALATLAMVYVTITRYQKNEL